MTDVEREGISLERIKQYIDNTIENLNAICEFQKEQDLFSNKENFALIFEKVSLSYTVEDGEEKKIANALENNSFSIKKGEKVAFCGR